MKKNRKGTKKILIDIGYEGSINEFEEFYGFNITYKELEQKSYIELKDTLFKEINENIKFRKDNRIGRILTIKAFMYDEEIEKLLELIEENKIKTIYDWVIKDLTVIKE